MHDAEQLTEQHITFAFGQFLIAADKTRYIPTDDDVDCFLTVARRVIEQSRTEGKPE